MRGENVKYSFPAYIEFVEGCDWKTVNVKSLTYTTPTV